MTSMRAKLSPHAPIEAHQPRVATLLLLFCPVCPLTCFSVNRLRIMKLEGRTKLDPNLTRTLNLTLTLTLVEDYEARRPYLALH